ncbi:MAG TPA: ABC transporter permease [Nitrososphaerales archaeon]|nr:ABC transporter permease [Nitrososphaerales archaeon]
MAEERTVTKSNPFQGTWTLFDKDIKGWYKSYASLFIALVQPIVWLALYGKAIDYTAIFSSGSFNIPGVNLSKQVLDSLGSQFIMSTFGTSDYFSFLTTGMLAFIVLFGAVFSGINLVFERRGGFLSKVITTPVSRSVIVTSKVLSAVAKSLVQAAMLLIVGIVLGMQLSHLSVPGIVETFAALSLLAIGMASAFMMTALRTTNWQLQLAIMNFISLPLLFASNALFPIKFMPLWMQYIARANPMSYAADAARQLLLGSPGMVSLQLDFAFLFAFALAFLLIGWVLSQRFLSR